MIQFIILLTGGLAIWFISRTEQWSRWGYVIGLAGQPFWFYTTIVNDQWGLVILSIVYTYSFCQGIYNYWINYES